MDGFKRGKFQKNIKHYPCGFFDWNPYFRPGTLLNFMQQSALVNNILFWFGISIRHGTKYKYIKSNLLGFVVNQLKGTIPFDIC